MMSCCHSLWIWSRAPQHQFRSNLSRSSQLSTTIILKTAITSLIEMEPLLTKSRIWRTRQIIMKNKSINLLLSSTLNTTWKAIWPWEKTLRSVLSTLKIISRQSGISFKPCKLIPLYSNRILFFTCVETPYVITFLSVQTPSGIWAIEGCIDLIFLVDLILNFFTATYNSEFVLVDDKKVMCNPNTW